MDIKEFLEIWKSEGYSVEEGENCRLEYNDITHKNSIIGYLNQPNIYSGDETWKLTFDYSCFYEKSAKYPINLSLPQTEEQYLYLLDALKWLSTEEGYNATNEYNTELWITEYPSNLLELQLSGEGALDVEEVLRRLECLGIHSDRISDKGYKLTDESVGWDELVGRVYRKGVRWAIALDYAGLFDGDIDDVPVHLFIPRSEEEYNYLVECIKWLGTEEAFKASDHYNRAKWRTRYP